MSLVYTGTSIEYQLLIDISTYTFGASVQPTAIHRYYALESTVHVPRGDLKGSWIGIAKDRCVFRNDIGDKPMPDVIVPDFTFKFARRDVDWNTPDELLTFIRAHVNGPKALMVNVYLYKSPEDYELIFSGRSDQGSISIDQDTITIKFVSRLMEYDVTIPRKTYLEKNPDNEDVMDPEIKEEPLPLLFGDWSDRFSWFHIPCRLIHRGTADQRMKAQICNTGGEKINEIGNRCKWKSSSGDHKGFAPGTMRTYNATISEANATFEVQDSTDPDWWDDHTWLDADSDYRYLGSEGDYLLIGSVKGLEVDGSLLSNPIDVIYNIMRLYAGVPASLLGTTFTTNKPSIKFLVRSLVQETGKAISEICAGICRDVGLVLYEKLGKWEIAQNALYYIQDAPTAAAKLDYNRILPESVRISIIPSGWNYAGVRLRYHYNPATEKYEKHVDCGSVYDDDDSDRATRSLIIESKWIYRNSDAVEIAGYLYAVLNSQVYQLEVDVPILGLSIDVPNIIEWTGDGLTATKFQVHATDKEYLYAIGKLTCIGGDMSNVHIGRWVADGSPNYATATPAQRLASGFWTADDGTIPGQDDPNKIESAWGR